jgi:hypothetical protein
MALTRGVNGKYPCPVCLVPNDEQSSLDKTHPLRTAESCKALVMRSLTLNASEQEKLLKSQSLRPVIVRCFPPVFSGYQNRNPVQERVLGHPIF